MIRLLVALLCIAILAGCASRHDVANVPPGTVQWWDEPDGGDKEFIVGVHNEDNELGQAEFSLTAVWPDGRTRSLVDHWQLPNWNLALGRKEPGTNLLVACSAAKIPAAIVLQDHLRDRAMRHDVVDGDAAIEVWFVLAPEGIYLLATQGDGTRVVVQPE